MKREAIILVGGFGTRLKNVVSDLPKPMAPLNNIPFLSYLLDLLNKYEYKKVVLAAGYKHEAVESYFGSSYKNIDIIYSIENEPLGTGGAISLASAKMENDFFTVLNGDTFYNVDFNLMEEKFLRDKSGIMLALKPMVNFERYGTVTVNDSVITSFNEKKLCEKGLINGGTYIISREWLIQNTPGKKYSFEKDILEKIIRTESLGYFISDGYFIDIGIPEDYHRAALELPFIQL